MVCLLLMNNCTPLPQNAIKVFFVTQFFQLIDLSMYFMCSMYLQKSLLHKCVLLAIGSLDVSRCPQCVYSLACIGVADLIWMLLLKLWVRTSLALNPTSAIWVKAGSGPQQLHKHLICYMISITKPSTPTLVTYQRLFRETKCAT